MDLKDKYESVSRNMLTHVDNESRPKMVNIQEKAVTRRTAVAQCKVILPEIFQDFVHNGELMTKKGAVFATAIIAGVMAAKKTHELIPFCHLIPLEGCDIQIHLFHTLEVHISCSVETTAKTGVEMEAMVGANIAALTIYDMCKSMSHAIRITDAVLIEKKGGKSDIQLELNRNHLS